MEFRVTYFTDFMKEQMGMEGRYNDIDKDRDLVEGEKKQYASRSPYFANISDWIGEREKGDDDGQADDFKTDRRTELSARTCS